MPKVIIEVEVEGDIQDAAEAIDECLDKGTIQDAIVEEASGDHRDEPLEFHILSISCALEKSS